MELKYEPNDHELLDRLRLGEQLIQNYLGKKNVRPSLMEPQWVLDESLNPFRQPTEGAKFTKAIVDTWTVSSKIHSDRTFLAQFGISKPMKRECTGAKSETYFIQLAEYRSTVNFKVHY